MVAARLKKTKAVQHAEKGRTRAWARQCQKQVCCGDW
jgi:hypothetical protein